MPGEKIYTSLRENVRRRGAPGIALPASELAGLMKLSTCCDRHETRGVSNRHYYERSEAGSSQEPPRHSVERRYAKGDPKR